VSRLEVVNVAKPGFKLDLCYSVFVVVMNEWSLVSLDNIALLCVYHCCVVLVSHYWPRDWLHL